MGISHSRGTWNAVSSTRCNRPYTCCTRPSCSFPAFPGTLVDLNVQNTQQQHWIVVNVFELCINHQKCDLLNCIFCGGASFVYCLVSVRWLDACRKIFFLFHWPQYLRWVYYYCWLRSDTLFIIIIIIINVTLMFTIYYSLFSFGYGERLFLLRGCCKPYAS